MEHNNNNNNNNIFSTDRLVTSGTYLSKYNLCPPVVISLLSIN